MMDKSSDINGQPASKSMAEVDNMSPPEVEKGTISVLDEKAVDIALTTLQQLGHYEYTAEEERAVVRKIDWWLMPMMALTFGLYSMDKGVISYAALFDLKSDNHLVGQQYSLLTTLFFIGWLIWEYPGNLLAQKFPIAKFIAITLFIWGVLVSLMAACHGFSGLAALRFLLGMGESVIQPLFILLIGMFYKRDEHASRTCLFYGFNGLAFVFGGPMAYAIGSIHTSFPRWKIFYLCLGPWTILWSILFWFVVPDSPVTAKFATDKERFIALHRLQEDDVGVKNTTIKPYQIWEAILDPSTWLFFIWIGAAVQMNIFGSFVPLIIQGLGFTRLDTALFTMPAGVIQVILTLLLSWLASIFPKRRSLLIMGVVLFPIAGSVMLMALPQSQKWARLVGVWLIAFISATVPVLLSYCASNVAGYTKKTTTLTIVFIAFSVGNIVSPQLFREQDAPKYGLALRAMTVSSCIVEVVTFLLVALYFWRNKKRDAELARSGGSIPSEAMALMDKTDFEDKSFRYVY